MTYVKHLVSKKKKRTIEDGFDLDLAYIKPNIVAMGFPSENVEGFYRNHSDDVCKFLELRHKDNYKVYNLCSEKNYDPAKFGNRVSVFGFDDHNAPPFELMLPCCKDIDKWLSNEANVAVIHCKAGKGRTGVMICAYLLYKKYFTNAILAMNYYADARTENKKGVTIPSQRRYITYFGYYVKNNFNYVPRTILLNSVTFIGIPTINSGTCCPLLVICQTNVNIHKSKTVEIKKGEKEIDLISSCRIPICGDIKIDVFHKDIFKKERIFVFWFNTYFLEKGVSLSHLDGGGVTNLGNDEQGDRKLQWEIPKFYLDKANKDKKHKFVPEHFKVRLNLTLPRNSTSNLSFDEDGSDNPRSMQSSFTDGAVPRGSPLSHPRERSRKYEMKSHKDLTDRNPRRGATAADLTDISEERNYSSKSSKPNTSGTHSQYSDHAKQYTAVSECPKVKTHPPGIRINLNDVPRDGVRSKPSSPGALSSDDSPVDLSCNLNAIDRALSVSMEALKIEEEQLSEPDSSDDEECQEEFL